MLFAATYPQRVRALVLYATLPVRPRPPITPKGSTAETLDGAARARTAWGQGTTLDQMVPAEGRPVAREFMGRYERMCVSPRAGLAHLGWLVEIDVRPVARTLRVPTSSCIAPATD